MHGGGAWHRVGGRTEGMVHVNGCDRSAMHAGCGAMAALRVAVAAVVCNGPVRGRKRQKKKKIKRGGEEERKTQRKKERKKKERKKERRNTHGRRKMMMHGA